MDPVLELKEVSYSYHGPEGETKALNHISFSIYPGEFVSIVGPSGCGKSTLLSLVSGLLTAEEGLIIKNQARIGYMLQRDHLLEWRTVWENAMLGLELRHEDTEPGRKKVRQMLENYGLGEFLHSTPSALSGGMRQRVALIRTLALEPELLLLDEPFSALDYQTRLSVADDIGSIIRREHKTALLVTHDLAEAVSMGNRIIILSSRPATVTSVLDINFSAENGSPLSPLARRSQPEFSAYFNLIWKEIQKYA